MPLRCKLELTEAQQHRLQEARDHDPRPYVRERSAALLKIAAGASPHWVARHGLLKPRDPDTIYALVRRYETMGFVGVVVRQPGGDRRRCL